MASNFDNAHYTMYMVNEYEYYNAVSHLIN